jgi:hypothetical protein
VAALASTNPSLKRESPEWHYLADQLSQVLAEKARWVRAVVAAVQDPAPRDRAVVHLAASLSCSFVELLAVVLAAAVDEDLMVGRALAFLQAPIGGARPTLGLLAAALADVVEPGRRPLDVLLTGTALTSGVLTLLGEEAPLPERAVSVPVAIGLALRGHDGVWPGTTIGLGGASAVSIPPSIQAEAERYAQSASSGAHQTLLVRSGFLADGKSAVTAIATALHCRPVFINTDTLTGIGPWLMLRRLIPVLVYELAPGERKSLPTLPGYTGPVLAVTGPDGSVDRAGQAVPSWNVPVPSAQERHELWTQVIGEGDAAAELAQHHRHGSARIQMLGVLACQQAARQGRTMPEKADVVAVAMTGVGTGLDALAQLLRDPIPDEALVVTPTLRRELEVLQVRCRLRDGLAQALGVASTTRYRPGVRALFVGPSGTGKTLAAGWLATRLGLPLYRVDLASVTSKYIGETEKNLAQLFAHAERAEVVLLFDEADSLFGKRTEVKDSNDRFANAQTNYVLQRIEAFDGIVVLTSNSRSRFDGAFSRRLDMIVEFPAPGPEERRDLWLAHLGTGHRLTTQDLNRLAATADLAGGHIRNVVLTAAVLAQEAGRPISYADLLVGLLAEYRKLGRQVPAELLRPI